MRFIVIRKKYVLFALLAAALLAFILLKPVRSRMTFLSGGRELPIYSVEREDNRAALTFDCAWGAEDIDDIINTLTEYNCRATFFVTGRWAEENSSAVNNLFRAGFEIGIHSYDHDDYTKMSAEEIKADVERCSDIIEKITGSAPKLVRAPSGAYNDTAVRAIEDGGRFCIQWSVDGLDYTDTTPDEILSRVAAAEAGDIILLHSGTEHTANALPAILQSLSEYELVTVSELIYKDNFTIDNSGRQHKNELL